jgi:hypothetical protein
VSEYDKLVNVVREQVDKLQDMCQEIISGYNLKGEPLSDIAQVKGVPYHELTVDRRKVFKQLKKALIPFAKAHGLD